MSRPSRCAACCRPFNKRERRHVQYIVTLEAGLLRVHVHLAPSCVAFLDPWYWLRRRTA